MSSSKRKRYEDPGFLQGQDPRHFMVTRAPTGDHLMYLAAHVSADGGGVAAFSIPAPAALYLSIAHRAWLRSEALHGEGLFAQQAGYVAPKDDGKLFDFFEDRLENIVFAFTAIEAFANQVLPEDYVFRAERDDRRCVEEYSRERVERHLNLERKLHDVLPTVRGVPSPKGGAAWNKFVALDRLRDRVIHLKWDDVRKATPEKDTIWRELIRTSREDYSITAHAVIAHYCIAANTSRWTNMFPYAPRRP